MKLEINHRKETEKKITRRPKNMLEKKKKINGSMMKSKEILKYIEANNNESKTIQSLWDAAKAALRGNVMAGRAFKIQEKSQLNT